MGNPFMLRRQLVSSLFNPFSFVKPERMLSTRKLGVWIRDYHLVRYSQSQGYTLSITSYHVNKYLLHRSFSGNKASNQLNESYDKDGLWMSLKSSYVSFTQLFSTRKGFGKFGIPRKSTSSESSTNDNSADESKTTSDAETPGNSSDATRSSFASKKTKKKSSKESGGDPEPDRNNEIMILLAITALIMGYNYLEASTKDTFGGIRIAYQEFQSFLLPSGKVDRIEIVNKAIVRVYMREHVEIIGRTKPLMVDSKLHMQQEDSDRNMNFSNENQSNNEASYSFRNEPIEDSATFPRGMYTMARRAPQVFEFAIGSPEMFEKRLEEAQKELRIPMKDFIPITYTNEVSLFSEFLKSIPMLIMIGIAISMFRAMGSMTNMSGGGGGGPLGGLFRMSKSPAKRITKENVTTSFKDVAGCNEAKREIMEFVEFLKNPEKFTKLGAKIPKGALLAGPPGTGKTLLAKATAGEANVPFFSVSGSDFVEMFVGLGASRVRELFKEARAEAPCIIFIDEIDAIGRKRGRGNASGGNDERENTLNQLLVEMDGFDAQTNVVILAGTNRVDVLDPALTRPGRFDRQIMVDKPDIEGRKGIFQVHLQKIKLDGEIDSFAGRLAALTPGFVGADIANVCNEAAIVAARANKSKVDMQDFEAATDRIIGGLETKKIITPDEKRVIAFHEAGHAIAGWNLEYADPLLKVTIVPRGNGALGFAQYLPKEIFLRTREQIMDIVCMALAGRASEQVNFGRVTTGASDDLRRVTQIVYQMVQVYGMNEKIGQVAFPKDSSGGFPEERMYSNATAEMMDVEVRQIVEAAYERTIALITEKNHQVKVIAELLIKKETITNVDVANLIGKRPYSAGVEYDEYVNGWNQSAITGSSDSSSSENPDKEDPGINNADVVIPGVV